LRVSGALKALTVTAYRRLAGASVAWLGEHADDHPDAFVEVVDVVGTVGAEGAVAGWKGLLGRRLAASSVNRPLAAGTLLYELAGLRIVVKRSGFRPRGSRTP
jgi:hypothetical protein